MDIGILMSEVEKARRTILNGKVFEGINQLHRLKKSGYPADAGLIEDIVNLPCLLQYLYDETYMGDAHTATLCLVALKDLGLSVDPKKINYIRFKKLSLMGVGLEGYFDNARPEFRKMLKTLRSFFASIGDYRECVLQKSENRLTFEEDVIVRFPNNSFRDLFLQVAFQQAIEKGLSFHWENHHSVMNQDLTGRMSWARIQPDTQLPTDWYVSVKNQFDDFIQSLLGNLHTLNLPRYLPASRNRSEMLWIVFARDGNICNRISGALRNYNIIQVQDLNILRRYLEQGEENIGSFIFHVSIRDFDLLQTMVEYKLGQTTPGAPFIVFAEKTFFRVMKDHSQLFPGCEFVTEMNPQNVQNLEYTISRMSQCQRRFVRLPVELECQAVIDEDLEHTRAIPVSAGGAFVKTHRIVPIFSGAEIELQNRDTGFAETVKGKVVYNSRGGSAIQFDNLIPFDKFRELREMSLDRHSRIVDTLRRSRV